MKFQKNINGNRLTYEYPYADALNEDEKELYLSATQKAEDEISRIWEIQERRIDETGDINYDLNMDDFCQLRDAIDQLGESITYLNLIEKSADWSRQMEEKRKALLEEMEEDCKADLEEIEEKGDSEVVSDE